MPVLLHAQKIERTCDNGCDNDPGELEPVKEGHPDERWILEVVKRRIEQDNERDKKDDEKPGTPSSPGLDRALCTHNVSPFAIQHQIKAGIIKGKGIDRKSKSA
jgi:hypothetical protein